MMRLWVMPNDLVQLIFQWNMLGEWETEGDIFGVALFHGVLWGIWKERNMRIFEGKCRGQC